MARQRRRSFEIETLEGKLLLSTAHAAVPAAVQAPAPSPPTLHGKPLALHGVMAASAFKVSPIVSNAEPVQISLAGTAGALGAVTGTLTEEVDEQVEEVTRGTLVLQNARGTLTLDFVRPDVMENLTEPYNEGFVVSYKIAAGTGAYAGATGSGTLDVSPDIGDFDIHVALR